MKVRAGEFHQEILEEFGVHIKGMNRPKGGRKKKIPRLEPPTTPLSPNPFYTAEDWASLEPIPDDEVLKRIKERAAFEFARSAKNARLRLPMPREEKRYAHRRGII